MKLQAINLQKQIDGPVIIVRFAAYKKGVPPKRDIDVTVERRIPSQRRWFMSTMLETLLTKIGGGRLVFGVLGSGVFSGYCFLDVIFFRPGPGAGSSLILAWY